MIKRIILLLLIANSCINLNAQRRSITINSNWKFHKGDISQTQIEDLNKENWQNVSLPHTWNTLDVLDDEKGYYRDICWYQKLLFIDKSYSSKNIFLHFEAVNEKALVFVNGKKVGLHEGGYTGFSIDITSFIKTGTKNNILVKVDNRHDETILPIDGDLCHFGGIYRDVQLVSTNAIHFDMEFFGSKGVFVKTILADDLNAKIQINARVISNLDAKANADLKIILMHKNKGLIAEKTQSLSVSNKNVNEFEILLEDIKKPLLWSDKEPNLYQLEVSIENNGKVSDNITIPVGFRTYSLDKTKGYFVNDVSTPIRGMGYSQDYDKIGYAMPSDLLINDVKLMKEMGVNYLYSLYPLDQSFIDQCDKSGIMAWLRLPILSRVSHLPEFKEKSIRMMKEMVYQNYNHPSLMIWGLACEQLGAMDWYWPDPINEKKAVEHMDYTFNFFSELKGMLDEIDPERLKSDDFHTDPTPYYYKQSGLVDIYDFNCWGMYQGWYHNNLDSVSPFMDRMWSYNLNIPMMIVYGVGNDERIHTYNPKQFDYSSEFQQKYHKHYQKVLSKKETIGQFVWLFNDFQREGRGDAIPHINQKGMVNTAREKKDIFYYFKALWTEEPMLHIAAKDWNKRIELKNEITAPISVYSNMSKLELFCNGKSYGVKTPDFGEAIWDVELSTGKNQIKVISKQDRLELKDESIIEIISLPNVLENGDLPNDVLCINVGQSSTVFNDHVMCNYWLSDKEYESGLYGYKTGRYHTVWNSMPAWQGVRDGVSSPIKASANDPLFQTFLIGLTEYQLDVPKGMYEVELLFAEPFSERTRLKPEEKTGADKNGERVFSVKVNSELIVSELNLATDVGTQTAHTVSVTTEYEQGILIELIPQKGEPVLSGIKLRKLY